MTDAVTKTAGDADEAAMHSIADVMREAATTACQHAVQAKQAASDAGATALETIPQMLYTGSYVLAHGVVHATVFLAQWLPQENSIVRGFRDGGQTAVNEFGE
jgi:hypothetical protein